MELCSGAHIKYQVVFHLEWAPKYRYKIFRKESHHRDYVQIIHGVARRHSIKILELAVDWNHVHVVVAVPPTMSMSRALFLLKGASSYEFFRMHPNMRLTYRRGHLLSAGKFGRSVGDVDLPTTLNYVQQHAGQATLPEFL